MNALIIVPVLLGWLTGWLVNYLADVLPVDLKLERPKCRNAACKATLDWGDYLVFKRCRACGKRRKLRTFFIQAFALLSCLYLWFYPAPGLGFWMGVLLAVYLTTVAVIDLETRYILLPLSLAGIVIGLGVGLYLHGWQATLLGGGAGLGIMLVIYLFGRLYNRLRMRRLSPEKQDQEEAWGSGDVTLSLILGLMVGWPLIWFVLFVGVILCGAISLLVVLYLLLSRKYAAQTLMVFIPLGPSFILSAILVLYFPQWMAAMTR